MKMFDVIDATIDLIKTKITLVPIDNIFDYEPGEGMIDYSKMPSIYMYTFESDFSESEMDIEGTQSHDPTYYIDVYVSSKALDNQGNLTSSAKKANQELRNIVSELYEKILMWTRFIFEMRKTIDINKAYVSRIEKLGTSKLPDSKLTVMAMRLFFKVKVEEIPDSDDGIVFDDTEDTIEAQLP